MSNTSGIPPYNNRFRSSSGDCNNHTAVTRPRLQSVSQGVDMFEPPSSPSHGSFQGSSHQEQYGAHNNGYFHRMTSFEHPIPVSTDLSPGCQMFSPINAGGGVSKPMYPGKPRRLSRQMSADNKRQIFAAARHPPTDSGEESAGHLVTSMDSGCDEVFVEVVAGDPGPHPRPLILPDTSLFRSKSTVEMTLSTSSTASMLPNPYNRFNHRIHGAIWCCSCFYLLFFCCLPAIHYMEQSDVQYNRNNHKRARSLGRTASFMFFTGTLIALSVFALIFFLGIFFAVY